MAAAPGVPRAAARGSTRCVHAGGAAGRERARSGERARREAQHGVRAPAARTREGRSMDRRPPRGCAGVAARGHGARRAEAAAASAHEARRPHQPRRVCGRADPVGAGQAAVVRDPCGRDRGRDHDRSHGASPRAAARVEHDRRRGATDGARGRGEPDQRGDINAATIDPSASIEAAGPAAQPSAPAPAPPRARASGPRAPSLAAAPPQPAVDDADLLADAQWLAQASDALAARDAAGALGWLDRHERAFPGSALAPERAVLRVDALCQSGRSEEAREVAATWRPRTDLPRVLARLEARLGSGC